MISQAHAMHPSLSIQCLCSLFGVSRSWFYARASQPEADLEQLALRRAIETIVLEFPGYGYRRVSKALQRDGWGVNHKRVLRIMHEEALLCQLQRRFVTTTNSRHRLRRYPNLLSERVLTAPNQAWVADITYIQLPTAFVYLACLLDAFSRRCIGWRLSHSIVIRSLR